MVLVVSVNNFILTCLTCSFSSIIGVENYKPLIVFKIQSICKMGDTLRREVLHVFKQLHRTRLNTFRDDNYALAAVRKKINEEYKKYKNVTNPAAIEELNKFAQEVEHEVRTTVIQAVETESGKYDLRVRPDNLMDNESYIGPTEKHFERRKGGCCQQVVNPRNKK